MCGSPPPGTGSSPRFHRPLSFLNRCGLDLREIWVVTVRAEVCLVSPAGQPSCLRVPSILLALDGAAIQSAGCFLLAYHQ